MDRKVSYSCLLCLTIFSVFYNVVHPIQWPSETVLLWWARETDQGAYSWWSLRSLFSVLTDNSSKYCYDIPPSTRHHSIHTMLQIQCNFMYNLLCIPSISWEWMSLQPATTRYVLAKLLQVKLQPPTKAIIITFVSDIDKNLFLLHWVVQQVEKSLRKESTCRADNFKSSQKSMNVTTVCLHHTYFLCIFPNHVLSTKWWSWLQTG